MKDFDEKFKQFQVALQDRLTEEDATAQVSYQRSPRENGILVLISSETHGLDKFLVYGTPDGNVNFIRQF